jgi:uroporphyrin-III C-methyltransferase / precorrin-2 dehydrogenase / sirohydrochlorin ferrochelatase
MAFSYPIMLNLQGRLCVVIGGGHETEQKVRGLLDGKANVRVFEGSPSGGLEQLREEGQIELVERPYVYGDLGGAFLAISASGNARINELAYQEANERGVLFNAVDDVEHCHFAAPAVVRRGDFTLTISTGGKAPALAKRVRIDLSKQFGDEYGELVTALGEARDASLPRTVDFHTWAGRWKRALDEDLIRLTKRGLIDEVKERVQAHLQGALASGGLGKVWIVGAGPGDPELITVRGRSLLDRADVIVHDRLVHPDLVQGRNAIFVGKRVGNHYVSQEDTNDLLVRLARNGKDVVRLKGGDPFVFGRGAEEVGALRAKGIPVEVVPAPTSATAALASAGIPVTDRRAGSSVAFATGHGTRAPVDWRGLARSADTIVVLMGLGNLAAIVAELIAGGRDEEEPAAVVENGTLDAQRVVTTTLAELPAAVARAGIQSPAVVVTGRVVSLRDEELGSRENPPGELIASAR